MKRRALDPLREVADEIVKRSVRELLLGGGWFEYDELSELTGDSDARVFTEVLRMLSKEQAFILSLPDQPDRFVHRMTPGVRWLNENSDGRSHYVNISGVPFRLKMTLLKKLEHLEKAGIAARVHEWLCAVIAAEKLLADAGLYAVHPRPDDGFVYPCMWHIDVGSGPCIPNIHDTYKFRIAFVGEFPLDITQHIPHTGCSGFHHYYGRHSDDLLASLILRSGRSMLKLDNVGRAGIRAGSLTAAYYPARQELIDSTALAIKNTSKEKCLASPFIPEKCGFELLSKPSERTMRNSRATLSFAASSSIGPAT